MKPIRKVLVIGIDGATFDIIDPLIEKGGMPNLASLVKSGVRATLKSTFPPNSAPAWVSFMTGKNPGKHGVYGFRSFNLRKYTHFDENLCNATVLRGQTFFDILSRNQMRMLIFGVPLTYPPWPINGVMVAGYPTPDHRRPFTFPPSLAAEIGELTKMTIDQQFRVPLKTQLGAYNYELEKLSQIVEKFFSKDDFQLKVFVTGISDSVQHRYWKFKSGLPTVTSEEIKENGGLIDYFYQKIDSLIGQLIGQIDSNDLVMVMSDHGSMPRPLQYFNVNHWLQNLGFLKVKKGFKRRLRKGLGFFAEWSKENLPIRDWVKKKLPIRAKEIISNMRFSSSMIDWTKTKAYRVPMQFPVEGININLKGRQTNGTVSPGEEYESLRKKIIKEAMGLIDSRNGEKLIEAVYLKEDLYKGPFLENAPDIVFVTSSKYEAGSDLDTLTSPVPNSFVKKLSGYHTLDGIIVLSGSPIRRNTILKKAEIIDLAPTILYALGLPISNNIDGKVLAEAFDPNFLKQNPIAYSDEFSGGDTQKELLTSQEEEGIKKSLKGLGYLD